MSQRTQWKEAGGPFQESERSQGRDRLGSEAGWAGSLRGRSFLNSEGEAPGVGTRAVLGTAQRCRLVMCTWAMSTGLDTQKWLRQPTVANESFTTV